MPSLPPGRPGFAPFAPGGIVQDAEAAQLGGQVKEVVGDGQVFLAFEGKALFPERQGGKKHRGLHTTLFLFASK
jgi:hypothetical protein